MPLKFGSSGAKWTCIFLLFLIIPGGQAFAAQPDTDSTATPIDSCTRITEPGTYFLTENITDSTAETCIEIRTNDVILDGRAHVIDGGGFKGTTTHGIAVNDGTSNVTITNLTATGWAVGVSYNGSDGRISDVDAISNFGTGIALTDADHTVLSNVTVTGNEQTGIFLLRAQAITVTESTARENFEGLWARQVTDSTVTNTKIIKNNATGLLLLASRNSTITNVTAVLNAVGLSLINTTTSRVLDNQAIRNSRGIRLAQSRQNTLSNNVLSQNSLDGISLVNSNHNIVTGSTVTANDFVGVHLENASSNRFSDLFIADNNGTVNYLTSWLGGQFDGASGIVLEESHHNTFTNIAANNNRNWTFYAINSSVTTVENLTLESIALSFRGTNVAVAPVLTPPQSPTNYTSIGGYVAAAELGTPSWLSLEIGYSQSAIAAGNVSEESLRLWRYNGSWAPVHESSATANAGLNTEQNYVYANLTDFGILTPFAPIQILPQAEFPSKPSPLTAEDVAQFVATYEEARLYNNLLNESESRILDLNTFCTPSDVEHVENGFYGTVQCGWNAIEVSPKGYSIAVDGATYTMTYFVNGTTTERKRMYWGTGTVTGTMTTFQGGPTSIHPYTESILVLITLLGFFVIRSVR